jgi:hypothetical protein
MQNRHLFFSLALTIGLNLSVYAQSDRFHFFSVKAHTGKHLYTGIQLSDELAGGYNSIEIRYGWSTHGKRDWEKYYNYPSYGVGWYSGYVGPKEIFGSPHAFFGFVSFPITKKKRNYFQIEPALGLTYNLKPYNPENNPINDAIGSKFAVYFSLHGGGVYRVNREIDLLYGIDLTHFSNGRTYTPNLGLNMFGLSIGGKYHFNLAQRKVDKSVFPETLLAARPVDLKPAKPAARKEQNISLYQALGTVQNKRDAGTNHRYLTSSTILEYQKKFNVMHGISVGVDALVDPSARDTVENPANTTLEAFFPAAHVGYDFMCGRFTLKLQVAYHLSSMGRTLKGNIFVRPAIRYEVNKRFFAQLGLKTYNGASADWVEAGFGYKIWRKSNG